MEVPLVAVTLSQACYLMKLTQSESGNIEAAGEFT